MKKTIFALLVFMLAGPVMAANVVITIVEDGNGIASINYTSDVNVRAFALDVNVTGANVVDVNNYFEGDCNATNKGFGIFLDQINGIEVNDAGVVQQWGSPVADACAPGPAGHGIGKRRVVLGMGALYEDGNEPNHSGTLCKFRVDGSCTVSIHAEGTFRGGVVLEDGNGTDPNLTGATNVPLLACYAGMADYDEWVAVGSPECWCYLRQCHGDADGYQEPGGKTFPAHWVGNPDLDVLISAWKKGIAEVKDQVYSGSHGDVYLACADFDHTEHPGGKTFPEHRVGNPDLDILIWYWKETHVPDPNCQPGNESP